MRIVIVIVGLLLSASIATAQPHPCDAPDITSARSAAGAPVKVQICQPQANAITALTVYNGTTTSPATGLTQVTPAPNAAGKVLYEATIGTFTAGTYTLQFAAVNLDGVNSSPQEGPKTSPFSLTVVTPAPLPAVPAVKRVP